MLYRIEPDYHGWRYVCPTCRHATSPEADHGRQMAALTPEATGVVAAVSITFTFVPCAVPVARPARKPE